ncbi:MAG: hypothetical protein Ta2A_04370 [Treponemataceae bacterium]|nr:MAG: hypothetical protein Ta2A_04370 [Treponemataceae bacterium]
MHKFIRLQNEQIINNPNLVNELENGSEVVLQFSKPLYDAAVLTHIDALCKKYPQNLTVRFYAHYENKRSFDCKWLEYLPNVRRLTLDCLDTAANFSLLKELQHLNALSVGIYQLADCCGTDFFTDFLSWESLKKLSRLVLVQTKKSDIDLQYLAEYSNLTELFIGAHIKNIGAVSACKNLAFLSLNIPSKQKSLDFCNGLSGLKKLRLILGGRESIAEIENPAIEELELFRVQGFKSLHNIEKMPNLQSICIEDQKQLTEICFAADLPKLKTLAILGCKTFGKLAGLAHLPALETLRLYKPALPFDDFFACITESVTECVDGKKLGSLRYVDFYTMNKKEDARIAAILKAHGYEPAIIAPAE